MIQMKFVPNKKRFEINFFVKGIKKGVTIQIQKNQLIAIGDNMKLSKLKYVKNRDS